MTRLLRWMGSLQMAVALILAIAIVLAWGTIYETRYGTASVQRFIYQAWWFQGILGFLAVNLVVSALRRVPWKRKHVPFLLAHLGIICILLGGIIGGRFGIEGQLVIREGEANRTLLLPGKVLVLHQPNPGGHRAFPTFFETQAWVHEPDASFSAELEGRRLELTVNRYYPDAVVQDEVTDGGPEANPAVRVRVEHGLQQDALWLFARDPERFGIGWGDAHVIFLEPETEADAARLIEPVPATRHLRGVVAVALPDLGARDIPVPETMHTPIPVEGTPYTITFRDYFPDFVIGEDGPESRSDSPNNPAVAFTLSGPEGTDPYLLFAFHPDIASMHGWQHQIPAQVSYTHPFSASLPPNAIALYVHPGAERLGAVLTGRAGERRHVEHLEPGETYTHPWLEYVFRVEAYAPRAVLEQRVTNRSDEVRGEALHVTLSSSDAEADGWVGSGGALELDLNGHPVTVSYEQQTRELPFTVKLLDFRKIDYPGTQMAAGFESDVHLSDLERGVILMRKISMNNPLKYRGYSLFQSSFVPGAVETTVLSVRNDPGTPLVYAGFLIVILGVVWMFIARRAKAARWGGGGA
ncbi:MAG TPA: cytochrome c biogenesis protein ResB [bacterium]